MVDKKVTPDAIKNEIKIIMFLLSNHPASIKLPNEPIYLAFHTSGNGDVDAQITMQSNKIWDLQIKSHENGEKLSVPNSVEGIHQLFLRYKQEYLTLKQKGIDIEYYYVHEGIIGDKELRKFIYPIEKNEELSIAKNYLKKMLSDRPEFKEFSEETDFEEKLIVFLEHFGIIRMDLRDQIQKLMIDYYGSKQNYLQILGTLSEKSTYSCDEFVKIYPIISKIKKSKSEQDDKTESVEIMDLKCFSERIFNAKYEKYENSNLLFVAPARFEKIEKIMRDSHIIIITGIEGIGKTYIAFNLAWKLYSEGIKVDWFHGSEQNERISSRKKFSEFVFTKHNDSEKRIYCFDDIFGVNFYESNSAIEKNFNTILSMIKDSEEIYLIITMNDNIWKDFISQCTISSDFQDVIIHLDNSITKTPKNHFNYDTNKLKKLLENYSQFYQSQWLKNSTLKRQIFDLLKNEQLLTTPFLISQFALRSQQFNNEKEINACLSHINLESMYEFIKNINQLSKDKQIFLALTILGAFPRKFIQEKYEFFIKELGVIQGLPFEKLIEFYEHDLIELIPIYDEIRIKCIYPIYEETIRALIWDNNSKSNTIFFYNVIQPLILNLAIITKKKISAEKELHEIMVLQAVIIFIIQHFNYISNDLQELLKIFVKHKRTAGQVGHYLALFYYQIPKEIKHLLFEIAYGKIVPTGPLLVIAANFDSLEKKVQNIFIDGSNRQETALDVAWDLSDYYEKFPKQIRIKILTNLMKFGNCYVPLLTIAETHFEDFSEDYLYQILTYLSDNELFFQSVQEFILTNLSRCTARIQEILDKSFVL